MSKTIKIVMWLILLVVPIYILVFSSLPISFHNIYFSEGSFLGLRLPIIAIPLLILWIYWCFFTISKIVENISGGKN